MAVRAFFGGKTCGWTERKKKPASGLEAGLRFFPLPVAPILAHLLAVPALSRVSIVCRLSPAARDISLVVVGYLKSTK